MALINLDKYLMGRHEQYPEHYTPTFKENAIKLIDKINALLDVLDVAGATVSSGFRPPPINNKVGGALHSHHQTCNAIDIFDPHRYLARKLLRNLEELERQGLYMESPTKTHGWVHLQQIAPKSGARIFQP